jgi:hypothetical protein
MWARLDDELIDHRKIFIAGSALGKNGPGLALSLYVVGLMYANRHLTDGHLDTEVVRRFPHVAQPISVADALVKAGLWEKNGHGYQIHDFGDLNPTAAEVKARRRKEKLRKHHLRSRRQS